MPVWCYANTLSKSEEKRKWFFDHSTTLNSFFRVIAPFRRRWPLLSSVLLVLKCRWRVALNALKVRIHWLSKTHGQKNRNYKALRNPFSSGPDGGKFAGSLYKKIKTKGYHFRSIRKNCKSFRVTKVIVHGLQLVIFFFCYGGREGEKKRRV